MRAAPATPRAVETGARHRNPRGLRGVSHVSRVAAGDSSAGTAAASRVAMSHDARVATAPRVFVMSDIHTDFPENMSWCASLSDVAFARDAVILGGDVSDDLRVLETTLRLFKRKFRHVFFTPGNHDLWIKGKGKEKSEEQRGDETTTIRDSLAKLEAVLSLCETCGVRTKPFLLLPSDGDDGGDDGDIDDIDNIDVTETGTGTETGGVWIVPVLAWHHASFDYEPDIPPSVKVVPPPERVMSDFRLCVWPSPLDPGDASVAIALDAMNDTRQEWGIFLHKLQHGTLAERESPILSFSHFLPRLELCPEKRMLFYPNLPKAVGSDFILRRIETLRTHGLDEFGSGEGGVKVGVAKASAKAEREHLHVFGHTHFGWDQTIDGVRYVQAPVSYPHEWNTRPGSLVIGPDASGNTFDLSDVDVPDVVSEDGGLSSRDVNTAAAAPLCVWDEVGARERSPTDDAPGSRKNERKKTFGFVPEMRARWSDHYKNTPRDPENTELAWWVKGGRKSNRESR